MGTEQGTRILELVKVFEEANGIAECYAGASKEKWELGWINKWDIIAMCKDAWRLEIGQGQGELARK